MPESTQPQLFPDSAVTGSGQPIGDWPITAPTLTAAPTPAPVAAPRPQADELPLDDDAMRWAA